MPNVATMAKKVEPVEPGREERKPVQLPLPWFKLLRRLSALDEKPHTWYVMKVLEEKAQAHDEIDASEIPPLPWEDEEKPK